jgi:hypothetical protein
MALLPVSIILRFLLGWGCMAPCVQNYLQNTYKFAWTSGSAGKNTRQMNRCR